MLWVFALILIVLNVLCQCLLPSLTALIFLAASVVLFLFFANFFRCPKRIYIPKDPYEIVSPADGKIVVIEPTFEETLQEMRLQVSIFMSVTDVHANWYPFEGKVLQYSHQQGRYQAAWLPKSSSENERSTLLLKAAVNQKTVLVRQIAGALACRIVTYAYRGKHCHVNEYLGFIKFGSRVDMFFPMDSVDILVNMGEHVTGNKTLIARFKR